MKKPQLDQRTRRALGEDVQVFSDPQRLIQHVAIAGLGLGAFVAFEYFYGQKQTEELIFLALIAPVLLTFMLVTGWWVLLRKPYMAVGSRGVAFPLACNEIIPWANIASINTYRQVTGYGRHLEEHVAVALELKKGSLMDYAPTWRSRYWLVGYRSYYIRNVVLLPTTCCSLSPEQVQALLTNAWQNASPYNSTTFEASRVPPLACRTDEMSGGAMASALLASGHDRQGKAKTKKQSWSYLVYAFLAVAVVVATKMESEISITSDRTHSTPNSLDEDTRSGDVLRLRGAAQRYQKGNGVPRDYSLALNLYREAAGLGDAESMTSLGLMYAEGKGTAKDPKLAYHWFQKAANLGYSDGVANLGWIHQEGIGVKQDFDLAYAWFEKAGAMGNAEAINRIGMLHADGLGRPKDAVEARQWFERAAKAGNKNGINNLGWLYRDGLGVEQDFEKARSYFVRSADMGNALSAWCLAILMDEGKGGAFDPAGASIRLLDAVQAGSADAVKEVAGDMQKWTADIRLELKRELARRGLYDGELNAVWGVTARNAVSRLAAQNN